MKTNDIGDITAGMDLLTGETDLAPKARLDIVNIDVHEEGTSRLRRGARRLSTATGAHSLWAPKSGAYGLYAQADLLRMLTVVGTALNATTLLSGLRPATAMKFAEYAGEAFFTNGTDIGVVSAGGARLLGLVKPDQPVLGTAAGALPPGKYSVGLSYLDARGEESGLSALATTALATTGGVGVTLPTAPSGAAKVRVYVTPTNGDALYLADEMPAGALFATVARVATGKLCEVMYRERMLGGQCIAAFNGRVYVGRGSDVWVSDPFAYGRLDPRHGFISFQSTVMFLQPVHDGVFVGTAHGVYFLDGGGATAFKQRLTSGTAPVVADSIAVANSVLDPKLADMGDFEVAAWLSAKGFALGMPGGEVREVQSKRIALSPSGIGRIAYLTYNGIRQLTAVVESGTSQSAEIALSSPL